MIYPALYARCDRCSRGVYVDDLLELERLLDWYVGPVDTCTRQRTILCPVCDNA